MLLPNLKLLEDVLEIESGLLKVCGRLINCNFLVFYFDNPLIKNPDYAHFDNKYYIELIKTKSESKEKFFQLINIYQKNNWPRFSSDYWYYNSLFQVDGAYTTLPCLKNSNLLAVITDKKHEWTKNEKTIRDFFG
jgi:hypothetical protein